MRAKRIIDRQTTGTRQRKERQEKIDISISQTIEKERAVDVKIGIY